MAQPFEDRSESFGGFASFGPGRRKRAFLNQLESELARAERVSHVATDRVQALAAEGEIDLADEVHRPRCEFYRRFLEHCLADWALSEEELEDLEHLRGLLCLSKEDVRGIHDEVTQTVYGRAVDQVLEDYRIDPEEKSFLEGLRASIGIEGEAAEAALQEGKGRARRRFLNRSVVHGSGLVASQQTEIELEGTSNEGFEAAVADALSVASHTIEGISRAELKSVHVEVEDGSVVRWDVTLKAIVEP